jgi:GntR family phosphonate transport system transcriptional regulator/GntR family transcriptional regulator
MKPQWEMLYDHLRGAITGGNLMPGSRLPTEFEASAHHGVSRNTVRRAYLALSQDGLIRGVNGRGSFVMHTGITYEIDATSRFRDVLERQGLRESMRVVETATVPADAEMAAGLGLEIGHPILRYTALILGDEIPFILTVRHIRTDLVDDLEMKLAETLSLTKVLHNAGLGQLHRGSTTVGARLPSEREAVLLKSPANAPVLDVVSTGRIESGVIVEWQKAVMNSGLIRLSFGNDG